MSPCPAVPQAITLQGACYEIAGRPVLTGLTLSLQEQRIGIIGRNGSGKSTFLRLVAGLIAPNAGTVRVAGVNPAKDRKAMLSQLGIVFQNPDHQIIFPTVGEELAFGLLQQGLGKAAATSKVQALLAAHGRTHWKDEPVTALSQGQRQFLCLLSVLAMEPETVLLDEPFSGLDLPTQARLSRDLAMLAQQIITITHDPAALADYDRVIWLEAGKVYADGTPADIVPAYLLEMDRLGVADADVDLSP